MNTSTGYLGTSTGSIEKKSRVIEGTYEWMGQRIYWKLKQCCAQKSVFTEICIFNLKLKNVGRDNLIKIVVSDIKTTFWPE